MKGQKSIEGGVYSSGVKAPWIQRNTAIALPSQYLIHESPEQRNGMNSGKEQVEGVNWQVSVGCSDPERIKAKIHTRTYI